MGKPKPYNELAWFWSDQGDLKLMIAGLAHGVDQWVVRGDPATRAFSTFGFRAGKLAVVNRAGDHAAAKRIIGRTKTLTPEEAAAATVSSPAQNSPAANPAQAATV
jgi:3-phenylpropionate/trans-cinnamate dioxygenase ferredoxin reductase subunit